MGFWFGFDTGFDIMQVFVFAIFAIVIVCFIVSLLMTIFVLTNQIVLQINKRARA